jgi:DNA-binding transcriptional ArsR family regulator
MLVTIFNSELAETIMLQLYQHEEIYASGLARDAGLTLSAVQKQLARFEKAGLLVSRQIGKTRLYAFNLQNPYVSPLMAMLKIAYETLPLAKRERQQLSAKPPQDEELWRY